jgi:hypothetical protein
MFDLVKSLFKKEDEKEDLVEIVFKKSYVGGLGNFKRNEKYIFPADAPILKLLDPGDYEYVYK